MIRLWDLRMELVHTSWPGMADVATLRRRSYLRVLRLPFGWLLITSWLPL